MDMFHLLGFGGYGYGYDYGRNDYGYDWSSRAEKSENAIARESAVTNRFKTIKKTVSDTLVEKVKVTVKLGCHPKSKSPLKSLPSILIDDISQLAGLPEPKPRPRAAAAARGDNSKTGGIDLTDFNTYQPGEKIVIPLSTPNEHLTGPCWRDFSRLVRQNDGWQVKRIAATPSEKKKYGQYRKSDVYFINLHFNVPGKKSTKQAAKKAPSTAPVAKKAKKENAVEPTAAFTHSPGPAAVPDLASIMKANPDDASRALKAAIESGVNSITGDIDEESMKLALSHGYSKTFLLAQLAKYRGDGDQKPAAKM